MRAIETNLATALPDAEAAVRAALVAEGFGVLTEIDVAATLREKLGIERPPLKILGACNPALAHRALELDPTAALVLPCNVVLEERAPGSTSIAIPDPRELLPSPALEELAEEAAGRLTEVVRRLTAED
ncbi:MAG TPA: DUF302 domain-containing protein [Acidimicrobiales bacterium]|nr:DUF302 domain-containing protein [Acidimicrobiales bacterium]